MIATSICFTDIPLFPHQCALPHSECLGSCWGNDTLKLQHLSWARGARTQIGQEAGHRKDGRNEMLCPPHQHVCKSSPTKGSSEHSKFPSSHKRTLPAQRCIERDSPAELRYDRDA